MPNLTSALPATTPTTPAVALPAEPASPAVEAPAVKAAARKRRPVVKAALAAPARVAAPMDSPPPVKTAKASKAPKAARARPAAKAVEAAKPAEPIKAVKRAKPPKPSKPATPAQAVALPAAAAEAGKPARTKEKLVRDSFTMPRADFALIQQLKDRMLAVQRHTRKSELLRAGLQALAALGDAPLRRLLDGLPALKAGRPRKAG